VECTEPPAPQLSTEEHVATNASQKMATDSELSLYHLEGDGDGSQQPGKVNKAEIDEQRNLLEAQVAEEGQSENSSADVVTCTQVSFW